MLFALQNPYIIDVVEQPPVTPEITYPQVILDAMGSAGLIMVLAVAAGLLTGAIIIYFKKRGEATAPTETSHQRLRI